MKQKLAILGSTGSIGIQTLDIVRSFPDNFRITSLTANSRWEELVCQAIEFLPDSVVIADRSHYDKVKEALANFDIKVYAGSDSVKQIVKSSEIDTVVNALVGYAGFEPTLEALKAGKKLALANKESLVAGGSLVMRTALENNAPILPIDSEHSAILQCISGGTGDIYRIILTASGGPFRDLSPIEMEKVTVEDALAHPNWSMGDKITIDSATMMNKGFEVIEAHWLFGLRPENIDVAVHPQSIVHSMVEYVDGAVIAQLGTPDMHLPIQYALTYPHRWPSSGKRLDINDFSRLDFSKPDTEKFRCLSLAYECLEKGGTCCAALNAANEIAVQAFLDGRIGFMDICRTIETTLEKTDIIGSPDLEDYRNADTVARRIAAEIIGKF